MDFERLKKCHLKRNIIIGVVAVFLISAVILNFTRAKYRVTESIPLVNGTINYSLADLNVVAMYQKEDGSEYTSIDKVPSSGYILNATESYCEVNGTRDNNIQIEYTNRSINFLGMTTKGTKCYLYFDEQIEMTIQDILANYDTVLTRTSFSSIVTATTTGTIYKSVNSSQYDDDGEVYYFAGNPTDNWVQFANKYWRIIRINGDGTIRLIYAGTNKDSTSDDTIGTSAFNSTRTDNMYVGYMYQSNQVHGLQQPSTIKGVLDTWYDSNLASYKDYLDGNAGFCNDRTPSSGSGIGTEYTLYAAFIRLISTKAPTFKCSDSSDLFTTSGSSDGNKTLTNPIGLITADEVAFAGGVWGTPNEDYYLDIEQDYWAMSSTSFSSGGATVFLVDSVGALVSINVNNNYGVRPVINLKADTQFTGTGTTEDPFIVV